MTTATVRKFTVKKSESLKRYTFHVEFDTGRSKIERKFTQYGSDKNIMLKDLCEQIKKQFAVTTIVYDRMGLQSPLYSTRCVLVTADGKTYVRIHYMFNERVDNFTYDYECEPGTDACAWSKTYLAINTPEGEYYRYCSAHPEHGIK